MQKDNFSRLEFSSLSGYNFYLFPDKINDGENTIATHVPSDTQVRVVPLGAQKNKMSGRQAEWHSAILLDPVMKDYLEWPVDIVETVEDNVVKLYYIFNPKAYPTLKDISELLYEDSGNNKNTLDWRNPWMMKIARNLLVAFDELDRNGYMYHNFSMKNIRYNPQTGDVLLKFSTKLRRKGSETVFDDIDAKSIATEFAPPYIYDKYKYSGRMDENADYYQIAALLFRMMIGKLPYEGRQFYSNGTIMSKDFPIDPGAHQQYFWAYHKRPRFIFEPGTDNELGEDIRYEAPKERWNKLPESVKEMFVCSLKYDTALREEEVSLPTPAQWLKALDALTGENNGRNVENNG